MWHVGRVAWLRYKDGGGQSVASVFINAKENVYNMSSELTEDKSDLHFLRSHSPYFPLKNVTHSIFILSFIYVLFFEKDLFYFKSNIHLQLEKN